MPEKILSLIPYRGFKLQLASVACSGWQSSNLRNNLEWTRIEKLLNEHVWPREFHWYCQKELAPLQPETRGALFIYCLSSSHCHFHLALSEWVWISNRSSTCLITLKCQISFFFTWSGVRDQFNCVTHLALLSFTFSCSFVILLRREQRI